MNLCSCCYDEAAGLWCGCEVDHHQNPAVIEEAYAYMRDVRDMEVAEQWTYICTACNRYTSGTVYYTD